MRKEWIEIELGKVCEFTGGGTPSKKGPGYWNGDIPWASIKDIKGHYLTDTKDYITEQGLQNSAANLALPEEIILATRINPGRPIRTIIRTAINQDLKVVKPKIHINNNFLFYAFLNLERAIRDVSSGTTVLGINLNNLKSIPLSLAPLPEQRAIVAKIEKLFNDLDNGIANLKTAKVKLDIYRQSVLKKAFEGELTAGWRIRNLTRSFMQSEKKGGIPQSWGLVRLEEVCDKVQDGSHFSPQKKYTEKGNNLYPYITSKNIRNNRMELSNLEYVDLNFHKNIYNRCDPKLGDVLLTKDGVNTGNVTLNIFKEPISLLSSVCMIRPKKEILISSYIRYYIQSPSGFKEMTGQMTGTAIKRIILKKIKNTEIPVPLTLDEQYAIVDAIESRLSACDKLSESIDQGLEQAEALRQSILKKAFSGELLSEEELEACRREPDWEPADKLLERIRKEKSSVKKEKSIANRNKA